MSAEMDIESIDDDEIREIIFEKKALEFAIKYHTHILKIRKCALPDFLDSEALDKGECEIPNWLRLF